MFDFFGVVYAVVFVPALDEPHEPRHHQAKGGDGPKGRQPHAGGQAVERAQSEDASLLVEVLHSNGAARAHQVVTPVLQQRVHGDHQKAPQATEQHQEGCGQPDIADEVEQNHQHAHCNAQRYDQGRVLEFHAHGGHHRADRRAYGHDPHQR